MAEHAKLTEANYPSRHAALMGEALAIISRLGRRDAPMPIPECCLTCAYRPRTLPNQVAGTVLVALNCTLGIDPDRFACHHGMKAGEPARICFGYVASLIAPWSDVQKVLATLKTELDALGKSPEADDAFRQAFEAWYAKVDPNGQLDIYQLAREYAKRDPSKTEPARRALAEQEGTP